MSFMNDVKINFCAMAECAGTKASHLAELARLKMEIAGLQHALNEKYCFLGRLAYRASREETVSEAGMTQLTNEIAALLQERSALEKQAEKIRKVLACSNCCSEEAD